MMLIVNKIDPVALVIKQDCLAFYSVEHVLEAVRCACKSRELCRAHEKDGVEYAACVAMRGKNLNCKLGYPIDWGLEGL